MPDGIRDVFAIFGALCLVALFVGFLLWTTVEIGRRNSR